MSLEPQNTDNQEIDLSQISKKISSLIDSFLMSIFKSILFFKKNAIIVLILFVLGTGIGYFWDNKKQVFESSVTVIPNFNSADHLYIEMNLINSKLRENDTDYLRKKVGILNPDIIERITIKPINDIYKFVSEKEANLDMIKIMSEEGDVNKIIEDPITSKNYENHVITIYSIGKLSKEKDIDPILKYIESSDYFNKIKKQRNENLEKKLKINDSIISQIDGIVSTFTNKKNSKNQNLVYYNDNTQLNEIIKTKNQLEAEQEELKINRIKFEKIIKESSSSINLVTTKSINGKRKIILPFLFVLIFISIKKFQSFYNSQLEKYKKLQ